MRLSALAFAFALSAAPAVAPLAADAQPRMQPPIGSIEVSVGAPLQAKTHEYGQRDVDGLVRDLQTSVTRSLQSKGRWRPGAGATLRLVIVDAKPNRPTMAQLGATPGLSMRSIGVGGATIDGEEVTPGGASRHVHYQWWETELRNERGAGTWSDADRAFDMFARGFALGKI